MNIQQVNAHEVTLVISDYVATAGSNEISVNKGQQVEIVEGPTSSESIYCLVRLSSSGEDAPIQEGLVPISILKTTPGMQKFGALRKEKYDIITEQGKDLKFLAPKNYKEKQYLM